VIDGFTDDGVQVNITTAITTKLHIWNSSIRNNVNNNILMAGTVVGSTIFANIHQSVIENSTDGIDVGSRSHMFVRETMITNNNVNVRVGGTADAEANIDSCHLLNGSNGVRTDLGIARVANSLIGGNATGLVNVAGTLETYQNNMNRGNGAATSGVITPVNPS
jgi:hypothetical protein